jgi:raffinose/stachyose/melibiose transport system permease protein
MTMTTQVKRRGMTWDISILRNRTTRLLIYALLIAWALVNFLPLAWVALAGFKNDVEIFQQPFALPQQWKFENYEYAYEAAHLGQYLGNSAVFSAGVTALSLALATLCAYPFSRFNFRLKGVLWAFLMAMFLLPGSMRAIPLIVFLMKVGLYGTMPAIIIAYATGGIPFSTFFLRAFMESTIPRELEEAAVMDGANMLQVFSRIIIPLSTPALATLGIFTFLGAWNELFFVLLLSRDVDTYTIPAGIATLSGARITQHAYIAAAFTISLLPVLIVFILAQRYVVKGMTAGAVRGV